MLIIDGDLYVYKAGFAYKGKEVGFKIVNKIDNEEIDFGNISLIKAKEKCKENSYSNIDWSLVYYNDPFPLSHVLKNLDEMIQRMLDKFPGDYYKMFITSSDHSNYRFSVASIVPYKGSRRKCSKCFARCSAKFVKGDNIELSCKNCGVVCNDTTSPDKPHYYNEIRDHLANKWGAELVHDQEADDSISICSVKESVLQNESVGPVVMVHIDKDINNTPGWHYNPDKEKLYYVSEEESLNNFYSQFLLGDNVDNIPGVTGVGPIACKEIFQSCKKREDYEHIIMEIYQGEYNFNKRKPKEIMNLTPKEAYDRLTEIGQLLHIRQKEGELWKPTIVQP